MYLILIFCNICLLLFIDELKLMKGVGKGGGGVVWDYEVVGCYDKYIIVIY